MAPAENLIVHWQGGDHTRLQVKKDKFGHTRWVTDDNIVDLVTALARHMPDHAIAMVLNRSGKKTSHGHSWTRGSVCSLRHQNEFRFVDQGSELNAARPRSMKRL